jgi:hypothetical protein
VIGPIYLPAPQSGSERGGVDSLSKIGVLNDLLLSLESDFKLSCEAISKAEITP